MFKKLLSSATIMFLAFCMNAGAQELYVHGMCTNKTAPKFAATPRTSVLDVAADETWMGYWNGGVNEQTSMLGMNMIPMQYDVAICYPAGDIKIKDLEITGIRFTFPNSENIENLRIWMSTTIPVTAEQADIVCDNVTNVTGLQNTTDFLNEIRFSKSYKVDETLPLYIGYSFDVNNGQGEADNYPIIIDMGVGDIENALILKIGGEAGDWMDYYGNGFGIAAIQILAKGSLPANAVSLQPELPDAKGVVGSSDITFPVENIGTNPLTSIKVATSVNGAVLSECEYTFEKPLNNIGSRADVTITSGMPETSGVYQLDIMITEVNGEVLEEPVTASMGITVISERVIHRPLLEEFTGMWTGWAPRGIIAYERLYGIYGDDLSYIAVHTNDEIKCMEYNSITENVLYYPAANIDRTYISVDPYYGSSLENAPLGINEDVRKAVETISVADVSAEFSINDNVIDATSNVKFLYSEDASHYAVGYVLLEDGMKNDEWLQTNAYSGFYIEGLEEQEPLFGPWINGKTSVSGVVFDNVAIATRGIDCGVEGSIPSPITEGETYSYTANFDLADYPAIQCTENLRLVVILFDTNTGYVENTASAHINVKTSVKGVDSENVVESARYAVDGSIISSPQKGINIVKFSDGSIKKVVIR